MCGRFVASRPIADVVEQFGVDEIRIGAEEAPGPRYNVAPQDRIVAVRDVARPEQQQGAAPVERRLGLYRWGLIPSWAREPKAGTRSFNARAETLLERPMFRGALAKRRCVVPADAFYEWQAPAGAGSKGRPRRQPWCFRAANGALLAFAGLYELWKGPGEDGEWVPSCTIITTEANALLRTVHDRMPALLSPEQYDAWLRPGALGGEDLHRLLRPAPDGLLVGYRVGFEVSSSRSEGPRLAEPLREAL